MSELASAVRELRETLRSQSIGSPGGGVRPAPALPQADFRAWLPELPQDTPNRARAYTRQHLFWSEQQVLDHYGLPDGIGGDAAGVTWYYTDPDRGPRSFRVQFIQGRVSGIDAK